MAINNRDRVGNGLDELQAGLAPFVERELKSKLGGYWVEELTGRSPQTFKPHRDGIHWDSHALLKAMGDNWQKVFGSVLGHVERAYVGELREVRNRWAHQEPFASDEVYRALDTMRLLLQAVSAPASAEKLRTQQENLQRQIYDEQARNKTRRQTSIEGVPLSGLKGWREIMTPHRDVASGNYLQAEFAADLAQVYQGKGSSEYLDPQEFFQRTYITVGLQELLTGALQRMTGAGGDPVLELQTNFGGGKTHSMLALFHLFGGVETSSLEGMEPVLQDAGVNAAPEASRAVLVGTALSPGQVSTKSDGTEVRTLWGEMAWQLGGAKGYAMVADSDRQGTSPGSETLAELFQAHAPCLILIDEWVAYARQLFDKHDLPAGNFDAQSSFAQALTEAAKAAPKTLVVASIPQSRIEIGGDNGQRALEVLRNIFSRVARPWRAATGEEGFEIVRRRLFEPISGRDNFAARDAVTNAFGKLYRDNDRDFPRECGEGAYLKELRASYPIHPELFRRLYDDWSTLDKFQRTRGVLRLLAKVIHRLWESQDGNLLIMPSSVPMDDSAVKSELTRYLPDVWEPIISQDVDGEGSLPVRLDRETRNLGRYSACRRVARSLYIATAPWADNDNPGRGAEHIRLACAQPGETVAAFIDALRRVSEKGQYIHQDGNRYWLSTRPNLNRTAEGRARGLLQEPEELHAEIVTRLESDRGRGPFAGVHVCPQDTADVPDEPTARLVILRPEHGHQRGQEQSSAREMAAEFLAKRGNAPRLNRNTLIFLAADKRALEDLLAATAQYLSWTSILNDKQSLNLDQFQLALAESKRDEANNTIGLRIAATWIHALVPYQSEPTSAQDWEEIRVSGDEPLAQRTGKKMVQEEHLLPQMAGVRLGMALDSYLWKERNHVTMGELAEWFPRYLYLPRVLNRETLERAVENGVGDLIQDDTFATAEAYDEANERYLGLRTGRGGISAMTNGTCVVKVEVARRQEQEDANRAASTPATDPRDGSTVTGSETGGSPASPGSDPTGEGLVRERDDPKKPTAFIGSVRFDGIRIGPDAGRIADEVLSHLAALPDAQVLVTMEIEVQVPGGVDPDTVRIVRENANTLKFNHARFEDE